jgi:hypothetical protein
MRRLKSLGLVLQALGTFGAISADLALAEEGILEPAPFIGKGGVVTHTNLNKETIQCQSSEGQGTFSTEKEKDQHGTGTVTLKGCKTLGFGINTLGDPAETIKARGLFLICLVNSAKLEWGVLVEATEVVHGEVPALKALTLLKGSNIGSLSITGEPQGKEFSATHEEADVTARPKCAINGKEFTASYESSLDTKADIDTFLTGSGTVIFEKEIKFMDK